MYKLAYVIRYTVQSKFVIFAVLKRRLIHGVITGCSCSYLIFAVLLHKFNWTYSHSSITGSRCRPKCKSYVVFSSAARYGELGHVLPLEFANARTFCSRSNYGWAYLFADLAQSYTIKVTRVQKIIFI